MADLRVSDAAMNAAQRSLATMASGLARGAGVVGSWDTDAVGAGVLADAFRAHDTASGGTLSDTVAAIDAFAAGIGMANQSYGETDAGLARTAGGKR